MNTYPQEYQRQQAAPTGGAFKELDIYGHNDYTKDDITSPSYNQAKQVYEPTPLAAGPAGGCSAGTLTLVFNLVLHVITAIVTIVAAVSHMQDDGYTKHLTSSHSTDWVSSWCIVMIVGEVLAVALYVGWFGFVRRSFQSPLPAILGGGLFVAVFISTLKLSYFLEIGDQVGHPIAANANDHMNNRIPEGANWCAAAVYFQCFVIASVVFTAQSGTYFKVLQIEDWIVVPERQRKTTAAVGKMATAWRNYKRPAA